MRALIVHAGNLYGGSERVIEALAGRVGQAGRASAASQPSTNDLEVLFALCFEGTLATRLRTIDAPLEILGDVRFSRPDLVLRARRNLATILNHENFDVVITQSVWSHAVFARVVRRFRLPLALWVHDLLGGGHWLEKLARGWQPDLLICNSRHTQTAARSVFSDVPSEVIHGPLALDWPGQPVRPAPPGLAAVPDQPAPSQPGSSGSTAPPDLPARPAVIVHVGRMVALKGHRMLIDALAHLHGPSAWECWFVGGPQTDEERRYESGLRRRVTALGLEDKVRFLGATDDVMSVLRQADIYCQPNEQPESFGLSLVEALHAGLPVVTSDMGGAREIVTDECGRLVPTGDVEGLTDALRWLIDNPDARNALGRNGPARAWILCNPAARVQQLTAALSRITTSDAAGVGESATAASQAWQ